ncbi:MAG: hypothetical protein AAF367_17740 [Pseudomonadota bacterium]
MSWRPIAAAMLLASALPVGGGDSLIGLGEWTRLTSGKTVYYSIDGEYQGKEYYAPGEAFLVFIAPDGQCIEGVWAYTDGRFCFSYGADFQCFAHLRRGEKLFSRPDTGGAEQEIERIVEEPLTCGVP